MNISPGFRSYPIFYADPEIDPLEKYFTTEKRFKMEANETSVEDNGSSSVAEYVLQSLGEQQQAMFTVYHY
jgi:hypothetical protein